MNAKDTIKAIKSCKTIECLQEFSGDERKSVRSAYISKENELIGASNEEPNEETGVTTDPGTESGSKVQSTTDHSDFYKKIPFGCRASSVIEFAKNYFGENFASAEHEKGTTSVKITLKDGSVLNARGI
jgi:hypothetical protein